MDFTRQYIYYLMLLCALTVSLFTYATPTEAEGVQPSKPDSGSFWRGKYSRIRASPGLDRMSILFGGHMCTIPENAILTETPPVIVVHGRLSSLTAVLVGYGQNEASGTFRSNKGYIYGVGYAGSYFPKFANRVSFTYDYRPPMHPRWEAEEFCALIFSPALKPGPTIISTVGNASNSPARYIGSTETIVKLLINESVGTKSKLVTQCCFLMRRSD
ncbi:hypothetical protein, conserved [Babesia bigemina]|uniref:Uncharacterized protein n=1 Tax=Babesia bigemina TaxID=5866 RepID=A0A061D419_BABBI|nr:hypothetical protein, conserved [Babesia bigemina]CDR95486.1 hypothetical protein, conserved [Babesia bigemina]|eukprot:XP_012767672.1 hypothetical protein, conserved [Babesia bigemina]